MKRSQPFYISLWLGFKRVFVEQMNHYKILVTVNKVPRLLDYNWLVLKVEIVASNPK